MGVDGAASKAHQEIPPSRHPRTHQTLDRRKEGTSWLSGLLTQRRQRLVSLPAPPTHGDGGGRA